MAAFLHPYIFRPYPLPYRINIAKRADKSFTYFKNDFALLCLCNKVLILSEGYKI